MDANKIINSIIAAAIIGLVTAVYDLNTSISELGKQIAVMEERAHGAERAWARRWQMIDQMGQSVGNQEARLSKLEWELSP